MNLKAITLLKHDFMKTKQLFAILVFSSLSLSSIEAQVYCSYSGGSCANGLTNPSNYASSLVSRICSILGVSYIETYAGNVGNACASSYYGRPIITYNRGFMNYLASNNSWAPISILAHEVGHHISGDISFYGSFQHPWTKELRADFVSGYVLYKMGASLYDATSALRLTFSWMGSSSHPDSPRRIDALTQGWNQARRGY